MIAQRSVLAALAATVVSASAFSACPADLDDDGIVGFNDLVSLLSQWGSCCEGDLDGDGVVGFNDLVSLLSSWGPCIDIVEVELAGVVLGGDPGFSPVQSFIENSQISVAIDPSAYPASVGVGCLLWVIADRSAAEWDANTALMDVRGAPQGVIFPGPDLAGSTLMLTGLLNGDGGIDFGLGYDIVVDFNLNGVLDTGDFIDGRGDEAGLWIVRDPTLNGPLAVSTSTYSGGSFLGQKAYWPTDIATLGGPRPLVVVSHGNGHQYTWYDYIGVHLASFGFVVMSHQNNTVPGSDSASITTINNTDYFLGNLATIGGGALNGNVDSSQITWIGHSRGGEGVARAYDRIRDGTNVPANYTLSDIKLISSIAPTDFLGTNSANPHEANYHLLYGAADGDVSGQPDCSICQSFSLYERATGFRVSTYVHGADHNDFNCCGFNDFNGPGGTEIGRTEAQRIARMTFLALTKYVIEGRPGAKEFLWRQHESLRPFSIGSNTTVDREYKALAADRQVIDDYQTQTSTGTSSSGGNVTFSVGNLAEGRLDDGNNSFTWQASDPFNGMTRGNTSDSTRGAVFNWTSDTFLEFDIVAGDQDFAAWNFLSLRACQGTRHPNTVGTTGDLVFTVTVRDGNGNTSSIRTSAYRGGTEDPYRRTGSGTGSGWQNEFETIRIPVTDFAADGSGVDLTDIAAVRFEFGPSFGSSVGRLGFDDVELTND